MSCWIAAAAEQLALKYEPVVRANLLDTLGKVYCELGLVHQAEPLLREAYEVRLAHPDNEADLAKSLLNMGVMARYKGHYTESENLLRQARDLHIKLSHLDSYEVAEAEFALGVTLMERLRFQGLDHLTPETIAEFHKMMQHVLAVQRRERGANHRDVGITLTVLAICYFMENNVAESEKTILQASMVFAQQEGGQSLVLGLLDFSRAAVAQEGQRFAEAESHYRSSISMLEKVLGRGHFFSLAVKMDYGGLLHQQGRMLDFERIARETLASTDDLFRLLPHGHPAIVEPASIWIDFVLTQGKYDEAVLFTEKLLDTAEHFSNIPRSKNFGLLLQLARIRVEQGELTAAEDLLKSTRKLVDQIPEDQGRQSAVVDQRMAEAALELSRCNFEEAERIYRECARSPNLRQNIWGGYGLAIALSARIARRNPFVVRDLLVFPLFVEAAHLFVARLVVLARSRLPRASAA